MDKNWEKVVLSPKHSVRDALAVINEEALRVCLVVDQEQHLLGVVTDGDIRRVVLKYRTEITDLTAREVMTVNPKTVGINDFAASALHLMEKHSITALAVVDDYNRPIAVVHIHDLLKAGVV